MVGGWWATAGNSLRWNNLEKFERGMRVTSLSSKGPCSLTGSERLGLSKRKTIRQMPTTLVRRAMATPEARLELGKWAGFRGSSRRLMDRCEL